MGRRNRKKPSHKEIPPDQKQPRGGSIVENYDLVEPVWHIQTLDKEGPYGWRGVDSNTFWDEIHPKLRDFESMRWIDLLGPKKSHNIPVSTLSREARKRLTELELDDLDHLFSLRLTGSERIWGIRVKNILKILWWDPDHAVCPVELRHT